LCHINKFCDTCMQLLHITVKLVQSESQGTEYIFHIGQVSALYKIGGKKIKIH
jgi:hypothetical protein